MAHPHHILRENKMITGAGADRMQTGMSHSFGSNVGRAAQVKKGQVIFMLGLPSEDAVNKFRTAFRMTRQKLPCHSHMNFKKIAVEQIEEE
jgi:large subunit ribosomal protein L10e